MRRPHEDAQCRCYACVDFDAKRAGEQPETDMTLAQALSLQMMQDVGVITAVNEGDCCVTYGFRWGALPEHDGWKPKAPLDVS